MTRIDRSDLVAVAIFTTVAGFFFYDHIVGRASVSWDFVTDYHPPVAYIIENLKRGIWPSWVARQSLGFPLYMMPQSDLFSPITWTLAALQTTYSLWVANLIQIAHIIFGGYGTYRLARSYRLGEGALIAGLAYMLMGGFFIQSQHVDIVRGFAWAPWLFLALSIEPFSKRPMSRLPFVIFVSAMMTLLAYPGQVLAAAIIGSTYIVAQLVLLPRRQIAQSILPVALLGLAATLGGLLGLPKYLPFVLDFSTESVRAVAAATQSRAALRPVLAFSTVLNTHIGTWPLDPSLRSLFVTAPVVMLAFSATWKSVKLIAPILIAAFVATVFALDVPVLVLHSQGGLLGFSRFPISDYKHFIALGLVLLAAAVFHHLDEVPARIGASMLKRGVLFFALFYIAGSIATRDASGAITYAKILVAWSGLIIGTVAAFLLILRCRTSRSLMQRACLLGVLMLIGADALRVYHAAPGWRATDVEMANHFQGLTISFGPTLAAEMFEPLVFRPERKNVGHIDAYSWRGFYSSTFIYHGHEAAYNLVRHSRVLGLYSGKTTPPAQPGLPRFMQRPSSGLLMAPTAADDTISAVVREASLQEGRGPALPNGFAIRSYSDKRLLYEVDLAQPALFIENEMFWKGWSARLLNSATGKEVAQLSPSEALKVLRSWQLPAGHYLLVVEFTEPYLVKSLITMGVLGAIVAIAIVLLMRLYLRRMSLSQRLSVVSGVPVHEN